jgi:hypothetical protein
MVNVAEEPQLGEEISFRYCRTLNEDLPCQNIIVCWEFRNLLILSDDIYTMRHSWKRSFNIIFLLSLEVSFPKEIPM